MAQRELPDTHSRRFYTTMAGFNDPTDKLINLVIYITLFVALVPTVLVAFTNLSTSGIVLATVISTIGGILLGVSALKAIMKQLK